MNVKKFLEEERKVPFEWGKTDCCATVDRWCQIRLGFSAMERTGRVHTSEQEAKEWISEPGGMIRAVGKIMRDCGISRTKTPKAGDAGIIISKGRYCLAIFDGHYWHSRDEDGFIAATKFRRAWRF